MMKDDNDSNVGVEQVAKDAMIKVAAVQRLLGAPVLLPLTASTAIVVVLLVLLEGVATNCFLLNATVSHDIDHFIIANAIVIIISYPSPHTSFIQLIDLLRSWNSCFSRLEVPHFGRERPTLVHMHVLPPRQMPEDPISLFWPTPKHGPLVRSRLA